MKLKTFLSEGKTINELKGKLEELSDMRDPKNYNKLMKQIFEWVKTDVVDVKGFIILIDFANDVKPDNWTAR